MGTVEEFYRKYLSDDEQREMDAGMRDSLFANPTIGGTLVMLSPESVERIPGGIMSEESERSFGERALAAVELDKRLEKIDVDEALKKYK
ncbi:hypothetical protein LWP59_33875 [Amycolatopsis acidiphila]|uniref:Uncharacterized protein n=1 Tax=Amycolatopsis acidiphila TaxID=715473 RepID=A0A558A8X0_9PSEU|nr:hypothetical protein [Amycolatopsis acidiphila]TVT20709.1 hypothetical protein FNH06_19530 [Amycolatopsis acidiphila]UIJ59011.1 hypothetical protein LWP59_33875 [Amycolatopsis acidiphila]